MELSFIDANIASSTGATINIHDPRIPRDVEADKDTRPYLPVDDKNPAELVSIDVFGPDHPHVARLMKPQRARLIQQAMQSTTKRGVKVTEDDLALEEEENLNIAVAATKGWHGFTLEGQPFPYSPENARVLYTASKDIMVQVLNKVRDTATFLKGSKRN